MGCSQAVKATDFDSVTRWFKSSHPSQKSRPLLRTGFLLRFLCRFSAEFWVYVQSNITPGLSWVGERQRMPYQTRTSLISKKSNIFFSMQKAITRSKSSARERLYPAEERSLSASSLERFSARHRATTVLLEGMYFLFDRIFENSRRSIRAFCRRHCPFVLCGR